MPTNNQKFIEEANKMVANEERRRKEKKQHGTHDDESNWLISYADMMTLLCAFFIMLFAITKVGTSDYEEVRKSIAKKFSGEYDPPGEELRDLLTQTIEETGLPRDVSVFSDSSGVAIAFESRIFFDSLSTNIRPPGKLILSRIIRSIQNKQKTELGNYRVIIEGHSDMRPVTGGKYISNWELSSARATTVARMFVDYGFDPGQIVAISYSDNKTTERKPAGVYDDEEYNMRSRRVLIRVLLPDVEFIPTNDPSAKNATEESSDTKKE